MGIEELVVKHRLERGEIAAAHRRIALVLKGEDFLVAAHRQTSLAVSPGTSGLQLAWRLLSLDHLVGAARAPAIRRTKRYGILDRVTASVCLDVGRPDHLAPLLGFGGDESSEIGGRARKRRHTQIGEPRFYVGFGKSDVYLLVQLVDDFGRCVLWCGNPEPITSLETRQELADGRYLRQKLRALGC